MHLWDDSYSAWCPHCKIKYGIVVMNGKVSCPMCREGAKFPLVQIAPYNEFLCLSCNVTFTAGVGTVPTCHVCGTKVEFV